MRARPFNIIQIKGVGDAAAKSMSLCVLRTAGLTVRAAAAFVTIEETTVSSMLYRGHIATTVA